MPAEKDANFYAFLDSISHVQGDEDAVQQNKRIKEGRFTEDSREPNTEEIKAIDRELEQGRKAEQARAKELAKDK